MTPEGQLIFYQHKSSQSNTIAKPAFTPICGNLKVLRNATKIKTQKKIFRNTKANVKQSLSTANVQNRWRGTIIELNHLKNQS
mmetsp:Transcript_15873/g.19274  ORF Transcript_15873/g.19274 Transcript_15873/m.19274 type:complete len:83 (-) Transcript_15873:105-353(-)